MDIIKRALLFDGKAIVNIVEASEMQKVAAEFHQATPLAADIMGRVLALTAFLCTGFKNADDRLSIAVDGGGSAGKIIAAGDQSAQVRCYIENPHLGPADYTEQDVIGAIGAEGSFRVVKDLGLKTPFSGTVPLVKGDLALDFAYYLTTSEQVPSAVALGGVTGRAGGIFLQALPGCGEEIIIVLEDIINQLKDVSGLFESMSAEQIFSFYFAHFEHTMLPDVFPRYHCSCSDEKIRGVVKSLGKAEAESILSELGKIEIKCDFCAKNYVFYPQDIAQLFGEGHDESC